MLNEDDLRPGDVIQDAMGDFWHVHDDGKIWCSEPGARISFEHARSAGPFKYAPGADSLLYRAERAERERDAAVDRADQLRYERDDAVQSCMVVGRERDEWKARAEKAEAAVDPVEELAGQIETATRAAIRQACDDLADVAPALDPLAVERAMEVTASSRKVAAHVLGQEARDGVDR